MAKKRQNTRTKVKKEVLPKSGIFIHISRSGQINAEYFDPENGFNSLYDILFIFVNSHYFEEYDTENIVYDTSEEVSLWNFIKDYIKSHDAGSVQIVPNNFKYGL